MPDAVLASHLYLPRGTLRAEHFDAFTYSLRNGYSGEDYIVETFDESPHFYRFPRGNLGKIRQVFGGEFGLDDNRVSVPLSYPLKFTGKLKDEQRRTLKKWIKYGYGMLEAPARWGKTVWMTALVCKLRQSTLMVAHVEDLCRQLEETIREFTNVNDLEEEHGRKLVGYLEDWSNEEPFPLVTLSTYQRFSVSKRGRKVIKRWKDKFGLVMVDEAHRCSTNLYTEMIGRLNAAYRCGVTATPEKKDQTHVIIEDVLGPVTVRGEGEQLHVEYTWEYTDYPVKPFRSWTFLHNQLADRKTRTKKIAKKIVEDAKDHFVLVTTDRIQHMEDLEAAINKIDPDITVGKLSGRTAKRNKFRKEAKRGEYRVVIAINKIVELGYNIPRWSCFHNTLPMCNQHNWYQRISRIRTPMQPAFDGDDYEKPQPVARVWVDSGHKAVWAYKAIVKKENEKRGFTCLNPERRRTGKRKGLATFEEDDDE